MKKIVLILLVSISLYGCASTAPRQEQADKIVAIADSTQTKLVSKEKNGTIATVVVIQLVLISAYLWFYTK